MAKRSSTQAKKRRSKATKGGRERRRVTMLTMDGISIATPDTLENEATYVLTEQGDWYEDEIRFLRRAIEPGMRVVDGGADHGCYTLSVARSVQERGAVLACVADPGQRSLLKQGVRANGFTWLSVVQGPPSDALLDSFTEGGLDLLMAPDATTLHGCIATLARLSPLIMTRAMGDDGLDGDIAAHMEPLGYAPYRLVPGLDLLAPIPEGFTPTSWHRQVFFCRPARAAQLHDGGYLALHELLSVELPEAALHWMPLFHGRTYAESLMPLWEQQVQDGGAATEWGKLLPALDAYALAHDPDHTPEERHGFLSAALSLLLDTTDSQFTLPRLCTIFRISAELGHHGIAVDALRVVAEALTTNHEFVPAEPFLPLDSRYDHDDTHGRLSDWILAQARSQMERLEYPTSYREGSGAVEIDGELQRLRFPDPDMARRAQTAQKRTAEKRLPAHADHLQAELASFDADQWREQLERCHLQWKQDPHDTMLVERMKSLRADFARFCIGSPRASTVIALLNKGADRGMVVLMEDNIRYEPLDDGEQQLADQLRYRLETAQNNISITALVAAMMYFLPHEIPQPRDLARLPEAVLNVYLDFMFLPVTLFRSLGEVDRYSRHMHTWMHYLHQNIVSGRSKRRPKSEKAWKKIEEYFFFGVNFVSMYQTSGSLKEILIERAEIMERVLRDVYHQDPAYRFPPRRKARNKIRLGVLARHYGRQTETYAMLGIYGHLDRDLFEIILFTNTEINDSIGEYCTHCADAMVLLEGDIPNKAKQIREHDLDILLLGTNVSVVTHDITMLALYRLARVQVTPNIAVATTGMRHWDYFIDAISYTEDFARSNCREKLLSLEMDYAISDCGDDKFDPVPLFTREELQIPDRATVYINTSSVFKITPELADTWATIIDAVPGSYLLLCPFNPNWSTTYPERAFALLMSETFRRHGLDPSRLQILSVHGPDKIRGLFQISDIMLDSYLCAAGITIHDVLATGIVPVMIHGDTFRTETASSTLGRAHFSELFAETHDAYTALAIRLGLDSEWRQTLHERIVEHGESMQRVDHYKQVGDRWGDCLKKLVQKHT